MDLEFLLDEEHPLWLRAADSLPPNRDISAQRFFSLLGSGDEEQVTELALALEKRGIGVDISQLPLYSGAGEAGRRLALEQDLAQEGKLPLGLEPGDSLGLYWKELKQLTPLSEAEVAALWGSPAQAKRLTEGLMYLVLEEAPQFTGYGVLLLDLMQEGALGLMAALEKSGENGMEIARWHIRQAMIRPILAQYLHSGGDLGLLSSLREYQQADRQLLEKLGRNPLPEELAQAMGKTPEEVTRLNKLAAEAASTPLVREDSPEQPEEQPEAVEDSALFQLRTRVEELLGTLEETDRRLLSLRFGLEGEAPKTLEEAAALLQLSPAEAQQRELEAIVSLRQQ